MAQMTPFELFGLKPAFKVDLEALHAAHERAILQVHPDRFADRPAAERRVAEQWASRINEAYAVLKDPVKRAVCSVRRPAAVSVQKRTRACRRTS